MNFCRRKDDTQIREAFHIFKRYSQWRWIWHLNSPKLYKWIDKKNIKISLNQSTLSNDYIITAYNTFSDVSICPYRCGVICLYPLCVKKFLVDFHEIFTKSYLLLKEDLIWFWATSFKNSRSQPRSKVKPLNHFFSTSI